MARHNDGGHSCCVPKSLPIPFWDLQIPEKSARFKIPLNISLKNKYNPTICPSMDYQGLSIDELVRECAKHSCVECWQEFIRRFNRLIASVVIRCCHDWQDARPEVIEDLIQQTYLKLCANDYAVLRRYQPRHENSFLGYLKVVTANVAYDHFRKEHPIDDKTDELDPDQGRSDNSGEDEIFFHQVDNILRQRGNGPQERKERGIFWLYYRHGMTAKEIASIPGINLTVKGVESCIFRLTAYIKKRLLDSGFDPNPGGILPEGSF